MRYTEYNSAGYENLLYIYNKAIKKRRNAMLTCFSKLYHIRGKENTKGFNNDNSIEEG